MNTQSPIHVSIDLETLGIDPSSVILSIGLAAFTLEGGIVKQFYRVLEQATQQAKGRTIDPATVKWWQQQSMEAQEVLDGPGVDTRTTLDEVAQWFRSLETLAGVYGFGADFDIALLQSLYRSFGHPVPWSYKLNRCGRTITALAPQRRPPRQGTYHNALDDAIYQANTIRNSLIALRPYTA